jgi:hypothetical protein
MCQCRRMRVTGVDACRRGWVAVTLDGPGPAVVRVHETLTGLLGPATETGTATATDTDTDTGTGTGTAISEQAHAIVCRLERARDLQLGEAILRPIDGITHVDTSGADLSYLRRDALEVPVGTTWSEETKWPTGVGARLRTVSRKYRSGRYVVEMREA